jgi:hypothetical protein
MAGGGAPTTRTHAAAGRAGSRGAGRRGERETERHSVGRRGERETERHSVGRRGAWPMHFEPGGAGPSVEGEVFGADAQSARGATHRPQEARGGAGGRRAQRPPARAEGVVQSEDALIDDVRVTVRCEARLTSTNEDTIDDDSRRTTETRSTTTENSRRRPRRRIIDRRSSTDAIIARR